eukprot:490401_1
MSSLYCLFICIYIVLSALFKHSTSNTILQSLQFHSITNETLGTSYDIGWIKVFGCTESHLNSIYSYTHNGESGYMQEIAPYAVTFKIVPQNTSDSRFKDYAVYSKICSNQVLSLNNLLETSYEIDVNTLQFAGQSNLDNFYAENQTAKNRLSNTCFGNDILQPLNETFYDACGNYEGIHIQQTKNRCEWDWNTISGKDIDVYFGFDANKQFICNDLTIQPSIHPTNYPTKQTLNPTNYPTINPT